MRHCVHCPEAEVARSTDIFSILVGKRVFRALLPSLKCPKCGEQYLPGPVLEGFEREVALLLAQEGLAIHGDHMCFMRKVMGITNVRMAELLGVSPEHLSRWEHGKKPIPKHAFVLVQRMFEEFYRGDSRTQNMLERPADSYEPGKVVDIEVRAPVCLTTPE